MNKICREGLKENIIKILKDNCKYSKLYSKCLIMIDIDELAELIVNEADAYSNAFIEGCLV